ncbi:MAG: DUF4258 domain-containing protein [Acidobacteriota bacterium]|jgi:hypothetical protein|nr:DUF4258 domain-containing protein [Acidobacteriota bacterium]
MRIEEIREFCSDERIYITQHSSLRMLERSISYDDVLNAVMTGEIIEEYPTDHPYPSYLILGTERYPLHIVCGFGNKQLFIITTYKPDAEKWSEDWKTRKGGVR